jgi:gamma-D-glutamyl-L-lysine dipeptidyl-peptidase
VLARELRMIAVVASAMLPLSYFPAIGQAQSEQDHGRRWQARQTRSADMADTSTDFLSDDDWRRLPREARRQRSTARTVARYTDGESTSSAKIAAYLDKYRQFNVYDPRLYLFKVSAEHIPGTDNELILKGETSLRQFKAGAESTMKDLGFIVKENQIRLLPDEALAPNSYAIATTYAATMRKEPRGRAEQVNSVGLGGSVRLLRVARPDDLTTGAITDVSDWILAQTTEGYMGFMRSSELQRTDQLHIPSAILTKTTTVTLDGVKIVLPVGALLHGKRGAYALIPDGKIINAKLQTAPLGKPLFTKKQIVELMKPLLGNTKYVWGGVTETGIDCSGFTQYLWKSRGIYLPRDAEEQAIVGQIVAWGPDVATHAQPGDLIFFAGRGGKVSHVGVSLGNGELMHSSGGKGVNITTLAGKDEDDDNSLLDRALFARRMQGN